MLQIRRHAVPWAALVVVFFMAEALVPVAGQEQAAPAQTEPARPAPPQTAKPPVVKKFEPPLPELRQPDEIPPPPPDLIPHGTPPAVPTSSDLIQLLLGRTADALPAPSIPQVTRAIIGLVVLLALAYLGGHPKVRALEQQINIAHAVTTGLPFFLLGFVASLSGVGVLGQDILREVSPLLPLGLGWIGFTIGSRFDARAMEKLAPGITTIAFAATAVPFGVIMAANLGAIWLTREKWSMEVLRDAVLLATAGAMAARSAPHFLRALLPGKKAPERLLRIVELEQLGGVLGIMMVSAYYRPLDAMVAWRLPGTAWLFISIGIGASLGIVLYALLTRFGNGPQQTAVLLGAVAFTAGMASYLRLSPLAVCFIAGAVSVNGGGEWKANLRDMFARMERPVYFLFMIIAGALWHPWEWQGWLLMVIFVASRLVSKWLTGAVLARSSIGVLAPEEKRALTLAPMGALSVAIVVSAQDLYSSATVPWIVTAVIAGSLVIEAALQLAIRLAKETPTAEEPPATAVVAATSEVD